MALNHATGILFANTGGTATVVSGLGFQPKFVVFHVSNLRSTDSADTIINKSGLIGVGWSDGTNHRFSGMTADHNIGDSNTGRMNSDILCVRIHEGTAGGLVNTATAQMNSDGFTLNWTTTPIQQYVIQWDAWGGSDITNVAIGTLVRSAATGAIDTNIGFVGDFAMFACASSDLTSGAEANANLSFGVCAFQDSALVQRAACTQVQDAQAMASNFNALGWETYGVINGLLPAGTADFWGELQSFDVGGAGTTFRVNFADAPATQIRVHYLVVKGGGWRVGAFQAQSGQGNQAISGVMPSAPIGVCFAGCGDEVGDGIDGPGGMWFGSMNSSQKSDIGLSHSDTADPTSINMRYSTTRCFSAEIARVCNYVSLDSTGFTINWPSTGAQTRMVWYAGFSSGPPVVNGQCTMVGAATVSATGRAIYAAQATIQGAATMLPTASATRFAQATIPGTATVTPTATVDRLAQATMAGAAAMIPTAKVDRLAQAVIPGVATMTPTAVAVYAAKLRIYSPDTSVGGLNDNFEDGATTGWSAPNGGTISNVLLNGAFDVQPYGTRALKFDSSASNHHVVKTLGNGLPFSGRRMVIRGFWRTDEATTTLGIGWQYASAGSSLLFLPNSQIWIPFAVDMPLSGDDTADILIRVQPGNADATARTIYLDQIEAKIVGTMVARGSTGTTHQGQVTMAGAASVTPTAVMTRNAQAVIPGAAIMQPTGAMVHAAQVAMAGTVIVQPNGIAIYAGRVTMAGAATMTPTGAYIRAAQVTMAGVGSVSATGRVMLGGQATMAGAGVVTANGEIATTVVQGQAVITGTGTVSALARVVLSGTVTMVGAGTLTATGAYIHAGKVTMAGAATMTPTGTIQKIAQAIIAGQATMLANGATAKTAQVTISGQATMLPSGNLIHAAQVIMVGQGALDGAAFVIQADLLPVAGTLGRVHADIYDAAGNKLNFGPLAKLFQFSYTLSLDSLGKFTATVPADEERLAYLTRGAVLWFYREGEGLIFKGKVARKELVIKDGEFACEITGRDLGEELANITTLSGRSYQGATLAAFMADILTGTGWSSGTLDVPSTQLLARFDYAQRVNAIYRAAEQFKIHTRVNPVEKTVDVGAFGDSSGMTFESISNASPLIRQNMRFGVISDMTIIEEGETLANKIIPLGGGEGVNMTTLKYSTRSSPYAIQSAVGPDGELYHWIQDAASIATYGLIERAVIVKEAVPLANSIAGQQAISNALYDIGVNYLQRHKDERKEYVLHVTSIRHYNAGVPLFKVGQKARTRYSGFALQADGTKRVWKSVDADLWILEFTRTILQDGSDEWDIPVSTVDRKYEDFAEKMVDAFQNLHALNVSLKNYTFQAPYILQRMSIDASNTATLYAKLDSNISLLHLAKLTVTVRPVRSNVSVAASGGGHTSSGGSPHSHSVTGATSSGGGSHNHTINAGTTFVSINGVNPTKNVWENVASGNPSNASTGLESAGHAHQVWSVPSVSDNDNADHSHSQAHTHFAGASVLVASTTHGHDIAATSTQTNTDHSHTVSGQTAQNESTHTHTVSNHTHPLTYGIFVGTNPVNPGITININGVDRTAALGGPFNTVNSEFTLDVTQYLQNGATEVPLQATNTIVFGASLLCDVEAILRLDLTRSALIPV